MPAAEQSEAEGFTVLRDATPPEFAQRRARRSSGAGRGCFAGLCKCLGPTEEEYGVNKARPHVIAQVGVNTSAPSSPKLVHGAANGASGGGAANGSAASAVEPQSLQGPVPGAQIAANVQAQQMPLPPLQTGLPKMHTGSPGEGAEHSARNGETGVQGASAPPIQAPAEAAGRRLPQLPPRPDSRRESDQQPLHSDAHLALAFGTQGTATPRVTHLQSAPSAAAAAPGAEGLALSDDAYVEKDERPSKDARPSAVLSIRRWFSTTLVGFTQPVERPRWCGQPTCMQGLCVGLCSGFRPGARKGKERKGKERPPTLHARPCSALGVMR